MLKKKIYIYYTWSRLQPSQLWKDLCEGVEEILVGRMFILWQQPHSCLPRNKDIRSCRSTDLVSSNPADNYIQNDRCYTVPHCNTKQYRHSFPRTVNAWDHVGNNPVHSDSTMCFKSLSADRPPPGKTERGQGAGSAPGAASLCSFHPRF